MASLEIIRKRGFRVWYERQLIETHAWLVTCFLGIIATASGVEIFGQHTAASRSIGILLILGGIAAGLVSWHRYRSMLDIAELLGQRAVCPACNAYGKFRVLDSGPTPLPEGSDPDIDNLGRDVWFRAQCKKCAHEWIV